MKYEHPAAAPAQRSDRLVALGAEHIGNRLRSIRKAAGINQSDLARRIGIGQPALSHLERRSDILVSSLRSYVQALGAQLGISARFEVDLFDIDELRQLGLACHHEDDGQLTLPIIGDTGSKPRRDVVFSIKPQYSEKILAGEKTVELRRRMGRDIEAGSLAIIYSTMPDRAITGVARVGSVEVGDPAHVWERFGDVACIDKDDFDRYFKGAESAFAIQLLGAERLRRPLPLEELRTRFNFSPPQSFLYAPAEFRELIEYERAQVTDRHECLHTA